MNETFIVDAVRTPQGRHRGVLAGVRPDDLAALVIAEAVRRAGLPTEAVEEVVLGAANQAGEDNRNVARMAVLLAGPDSPTRQRATPSTGSVPAASPRWPPPPTPSRSAMPTSWSPEVSSR
jgi:acetyl-CoA acetyltransferase